MYGLDKATPFPQKVSDGGTKTPRCLPRCDPELHIAAYEGDVERVKKLLEKGANLNIKNIDGLAPLHMAASEGRPCRCCDVVKLLLERGADPNTQNKDGDTPLHWAAHEGHDDVVKLLLVYGADPAVKDEYGRTPLDLARAEGHRKVVSVIEEWLRRGGGPSRRRF
jgi:ankyrin repeat protein